MLFKDIIDDAKSLLNKESISRSGISKFPTSFSLLRYDEKRSKIHQLVLEHLIKAEGRLPGGAELIIKLFDNRLFKKEDIVTVCSTNKQNLRVELQKKFDNQIIDLCFTAIELAGTNGKIFISKTAQEKVIIELKTGVRFSSISPTGDFKYESCKFVVVDGFIESVSEINGLLTYAAESKDELLIVCRGMSNDVLNTFSVNLKRSTINARPIIVNFDENGINTLKDICIATNSKLYSSDSGDLISSIHNPVNDLSHNVKFFNGILNVDLKKDVPKLMQHINFLKSKILDCENDISTNLIKNRLDSLCSRNIVISIPENIESVKTRQNIDECLRSIKHLTMNGIIGDNEKYNLVYDIFESLQSYLDTSDSIYCD